MSRSSRLLLSGILLWASGAGAATDFSLSSVFGTQATGCAQTALNSSTQARTAALATGYFYVIYCVTASDFSTGDACRYIQGGAAIDVTSIGSSLVGKVIASGQQEIIYVSSTTRYISAISKASSGTNLEVCKLTPIS